LPLLPPGWRPSANWTTSLPNSRRCRRILSYGPAGKSRPAQVSAGGSRNGGRGKSSQLTEQASLSSGSGTGFGRNHLLSPCPSDQELLAANADLAWLFLFHPSGYLREAALYHITTPPTSPFFLAALAWRLNDWVEPVRQAAKRCVKHVAPDIAAAVAGDAAVYLLERRFVWGRWRDEGNILDLVFTRDDVLAALATRLQEQSTGPLAACLRHALRFPGMDQHLPRLAKAAVQPSVRAAAYKCLISGKATWPVGFEWMWIDKVYGLRRRTPVLHTRTIQRDRLPADFVKTGIRDKSPFVRKAAADAMIAVRSEIPDEGSLIAHLSTDQSPLVRSRADFLLRHPRTSNSQAKHD
jgi:hypothetical protein